MKFLGIPVPSSLWPSSLGVLSQKTWILELAQELIPHSVTKRIDRTLQRFRNSIWLKITSIHVVTTSLKLRWMLSIHVSNMYSHTFTTIYTCWIEEKKDCCFLSLMSYGVVGRYVFYKNHRALPPVKQQFSHSVSQEHCVSHRN